MNWVETDRWRHCGKEGSECHRLNECVAHTKTYGWKSQETSAVSSSKQEQAKNWSHGREDLQCCRVQRGQAHVHVESANLNRGQCRAPTGRQMRRVTDEKKKWDGDDEMPCVCLESILRHATKLMREERMLLRQRLESNMK